jgi:hypothetical protein
LTEFVEIVIELTRQGKGKIKIPDGCASCLEKVSCEHCNWIDDYWQFDEVNKMFNFAVYKKSGFDLNRLPLLPDDFVKINFLKDLV